MPDKPPALQIDLLHLKVEGNVLRPDGDGRRLQASDSGGWVLSSFLFPVSQSLDSRGLREQEWADLRKGAAKDGLIFSQIKTYENGSTAMLEYFLEEFKGRKIHQKNVFGYIVSGGVGIDFHISKMLYTPEDQNFFDELISGIKLIPVYQPDSKLLYGYGSFFYIQKNWARAAQEYQKAVDLEKINRQLPTADWTVLVDNLGMAYAMSGNLDEAKTTFEYGVHADPTYPMFHYNLACASAESGDLDGALEQLKTAFRYKANSLPGEGIPDPTEDDSFRRYLADAKFQKLSKELCPASTQSEGGWTCN